MIARGPYQKRRRLRAAKMSPQDAELVRRWRADRDLDMDRQRGTLARLRAITGIDAPKEMPRPIWHLDLTIENLRGLA